MIDGWHRRKRRGDLASRPAYYERYPIGSDFWLGGRRRGWTAVVAGIWWWRTPDGKTGPNVGSEDVAKMGLLEQLGITSYRAALR